MGLFTGLDLVSYSGVGVPFLLQSSHWSHCYVSIKVVSLEKKQNENHGRVTQNIAIGWPNICEKLGNYYPGLYHIGTCPQFLMAILDLSNHQNIRFLLPNETRT